MGVRHCTGHWPIQKSSSWADLMASWGTRRHLFGQSTPTGGRNSCTGRLGRSWEARKLRLSLGSRIEIISSTTLPSDFTAASEVIGKPFILSSNKNLSFEGSRVEGKGFVLEPAVAEGLVIKDARNRDVLVEYLRGEDFTSRPDQSPAFCVINFQSWRLNRTSAPQGYFGPVAADYPDCLEIIERDVKPQRLALPPTIPINFTTEDNWWTYSEVFSLLHTALQDEHTVRVFIHAATRLVISH